MKNNYKTKTAVLLSAILLCLYACSKSSDNTPTNTGGGSTTPQKTIVVPSVDTITTSISLQTNATYVAGHDSVVSGGLVYSDGGAAVTVRGVCWSTSQNPTIADRKTTNGTGTGDFSSPFGGLTVNTTYYIRAYATNSAGTGYSPQQHVTTAYKLGERSQGGYIYYIDQSTLHGLAVTIADLSDAPWENVTNTSYLSAGAYSTSDGDANTTLIIKTFGNSGNAAAECRACRDGGYTDWYLPAIDQLTVLVNAKYVLNGNLGGQFGSDSYWSSTENINNIADALAVVFQNSSTLSDLKNVGYQVRAIRAF